MNGSDTARQRAERVLAAKSGVTNFMRLQGDYGPPHVAVALARDLLAALEQVDILEAALQSAADLLATEGYMDDPEWTPEVAKIKDATKATSRPNEIS